MEYTKRPTVYHAVQIKGPEDLHTLAAVLRDPTVTLGSNGTGVTIYDEADPAKVAHRLQYGDYLLQGDTDGDVQVVVRTEFERTYQPHNFGSTYQPDAEG